MRLQKQLFVHNPEKGIYGDCQRTCVAIILDMDAKDVPHFCDDPNAKRSSRDWWAKRQKKWLSDRGLAMATFAYDGIMTFDRIMDITSDSPDTPMILLGTSSLGSNHVVVVKNGEIVCDPSGNGICGPCQEGTWELSVISITDPSLFNKVFST